MIKRNKKLTDFANRIFLEKFFKREDYSVISFLSKIRVGKYIEVGAGTGRFSKLVRSLYDFDITCLEINRELSVDLQKNNFFTLNENILNSSIKDEEYNIVHCSHLVEHFSYPDVIKLLDELTRILKIGGYLIIRGPLMNNKFFNDIDHFRPYPPESILNYFEIQQQREKSIYSIKEVSRWYRDKPVEIIGNSEKIKFINSVLKLSWSYFRFPFYSKTGYVSIFKRLK